MFFHCSSGVKVYIRRNPRCAMFSGQLVYLGVAFQLNKYLDFGKKIYGCDDCLDRSKISIESWLFKSDPYSGLL